MTRLALITGASGGLGRAVTRRLVAQGWQVALVSRDAGRLGETPAGALAVAADCATAEGAARAAAACTEHFGRPPDALAHCAGSVLLSPLHRTPAEQYREVVRANLDSAFFTLGAFVKGCLDARQPGAAVLVSSVVARIGVLNHEAIAAAKAGVEGLVRSAAATYAGKGLRINAVAPGILRTPATERLFAGPGAEQGIAAQYPLGRYGSAEDGAGALVWLLSDDAQWITGQVLPVDGGFTAVRPMVRAGAAAQ
jgi:NAD(P)-dependent dehydrogenase (short-subunit alcohol dehydrogenase family)